jgi:KDO2-lipid IV(A) lauroyltransferase
MRFNKLLTAGTLALSHLPMPLLYAASSAVAAVACTFRIYRYGVVKQNLSRALPELSPAERRRVMHQFYRHLTDSAVEWLKMLTISDEKLRRRVEFRNFDLLNEDVANGHSVILYLGHYGNWELVPTITWVLPPQLTCAQIYRPPRDHAFDTLMQRIRNRFGALNIPQKRAVRTLLTLHSQGTQTITGFLADQRPNSSVLNNWTDFLGLDTPYAVGGEEIGRHINAVYYYLDVEKPSRGKAVFTLRHITPAEGEDYPYTVGYLRLLEQTIRRAPAYWLWTHKRWSKQRTTTSKHIN